MRSVDGTHEFIALLPAKLLYGGGGNYDEPLRIVLPPVPPAQLLLELHDPP